MQKQDTLKSPNKNLSIHKGIMEDKILAAIKRSVPAFVEIAKGERPDADKHSLAVAATNAHPLPKIFIQTFQC